MTALHSSWLVLLLFLVGVPVLEAQPRPLRGLDAYIERGLADWNVPGLAIAVVKNDSVVFAKGYGNRELGRPERVDATTIFAIGSASKAFTSAAVALLVDEGKVGWDDPASKHLPGFQLFDPYVTREMTVRDLLTHRSGLTRGDLLWYASDLSRDEILQRVRHLRPTWSFRSNFGYQNIMYLAAGQIVPAATAKSWDDFIRERIFDPLGMTASNTSTLRLNGQTNVATPHARIDDVIRPIAWRNIDNVAPAGSINSNVRDMAQWLRMNLNDGTYRGRKILSADAIRAIQTPETLIRKEGGWALMAPDAHFLAYGLAWFLHDHRGRKVVQHGGNIDGMHALVAMLPEENLGLVVLTNTSPNQLTYALMYRVFDAYLGERPADWSTRLRTSADSLRAIGEAQQKRMEEALVEGTSPSLSLDRYTGSYNDPMYGEARVALEDDRLVLRRGRNFVGDLEHWHFDTFRAVWRDPGLGRSFVTFSLTPQAAVGKLEIQGVAEFERAPDTPTHTAGNR